MSKLPQLTTTYDSKIRCFGIQFLYTTGGKHKARGLNLALHQVLSGPAPCFYLVAAPSSLPLVQEWLHLYSPKIIFSPLKVTSRLMWPRWKWVWHPCSIGSCPKLNVVENYHFPENFVTVHISLGIVCSTNSAPVAWSKWRIFFFSSLSIVRVRQLAIGDVHWLLVWRRHFYISFILQAFFFLARGESESSQ